MSQESVGLTKLRQHVESLEPRLTPAFVERVVRELLEQRQDGGSGVGTVSLVKHLTGDLARRSEEIVWAYQRLKPALHAAVEQIPSLRFLDGG